MRLAVLASGSGTVLDAIVEAGVRVDLVIIDRRCGASDVARKHSVPCELVERVSFCADFDRDSYTAAVTDCLENEDIELIAMAGFGTILGQSVHDCFDGLIINTHPALLPSFPGWHGVEDALAHGVRVTGCTVHVATLEVDAGPILAQGAVEVLLDDTVESLHERIKSVERQLYPSTLLSIIERGSVL